MPLIITKRGQVINSVEGWFALAPPKRGRLQWVDGRSAKELAKAFFEHDVASVPSEVEAVLGSHPALGSVQLTEVHPEHKIALDSFPGETRNADIAGLAESQSGVVAVTIEAKADESFGDTLSTALGAAPINSNIPRRIASLTKALMGIPPAAVESLRYQLLHGAAATLIFAKEMQAVAAVFLVFEFRGGLCTTDNLRRNQADFAAFVRALAPESPDPAPGKLLGPISVPGGGRVPAEIPLFLGKAIRHLGGRPEGRGPGA